ncbi:MAG: endonuclease MutS2 [Atribacterota bacterium]|nr:endonuclease MutS2 [Atribacterota bacterium]MDD5497113.1 endonuclease MutS2 [Atribacterota bacterium]
MDTHVLKKLDYQKIKELLKEELFTFSGRENLKNLEPSSDFAIVVKWQQETTEMKNILENLHSLPLIPLENDIKEEIKQAQIQDSILTQKSLLYIARMLECFHLTKEFLEKLPTEQYPLIREKGTNLKSFRILEKTIKDSINEELQIVDDASPLLKKIRQKIHSIERKIKEKLENIIKDPQNRLIIQDDIITIRQGRYVIPVKQQEKGKFPGVIHDKSESGVTVFMEPLPVVEFNNELRELYQDEKQEEYRILQKLTALVGQNGEEILYSYQILGKLDFINAKAKLSIKMKAVEPQINEQGIIHLYKARHPLLKNKVVPIDIELGEKFEILIITGPNTGGKTVTLKTVGLLTLMAQSGLHIPVEVDSEVAIFKKIFADIGDEQSMEQSLSTFSAHIQNIIHILEEADQYSLVLLDELGAGTDPSEGSALAMAILDLLKSKGAKVLSTTHHDSLKAYAYLTEGVMNAKVEFDEKTLKPTYKISIGLPGKSCAFAVAQRLGLPEMVLDKAEQYLVKEKLDLENLIRKMEKDKDQVAASLQYIKREEGQISQLKKELEEKIGALQEEEKKIKLEAYQEAEKILSLAQTRAKEMIKSLKRKKYDREAFVQEIKTLEDVKEDIKKEVTKYTLRKAVNHFEKGDRVFINSLGREGIILERNEKKKQYTIQVANLRLKIPVSDLKQVPQGDFSNIDRKTNIEEAFPPLTTRGNIEKKAHFKNEIDIREMSASDAEIRLEKYLDDAFLLGVSPVYIIHGRGKGILREKVAHLLKNINYVKSYRYGETFEGGDGVTVVYF